MEGIPDEIILRMQHRVSGIIRDNEDRRGGSNASPQGETRGKEWRGKQWNRKS